MTLPWFDLHQSTRRSISSTSTVLSFNRNPEAPLRMHWATSMWRESAFKDITFVRGWCQTSGAAPCAPHSDKLSLSSSFDFPKRSRAQWSGKQLGGNQTGEGFEFHLLALAIGLTLLSSTLYRLSDQPSAKRARHRFRRTRRLTSFISTKSAFQNDAGMRSFHINASTNACQG
jgi:hypothetical protein